MRNFKPLLWSALACASFVSQVQADPIKWATGLTFAQVKQKAKQENKYIFIDCITTWCTFCKQMDNQAYADPKVGDYFNDKFISVKVQFDQTASDSADVKAWYDDAKSLSKQYWIDGYPTFIFLAPDGKPVHKSAGFQSSAQLIELGKLALQPGKTYDNVQERYTGLMDKYKAGEKNYEEYPFMISIAEKVQDADTAKKLRTELVDYVLTLPREERYTKSRVGFWGGQTYASSSRVFDLFMKDGEIIDKLMEYKGYSATFLDKTIQGELVTPFFEEQVKGKNIAVNGMYSNGPKANFDEAEWPKLEKILTDKYGQEFAKRNMLKARIEWYKRHWNNDAVLKYSLIQMKQYPPNFKAEGGSINGFCWDAFMGNTDMKVLKECTEIMGKVIEVYPKVSSFIDTYAQLLYKSGEKEKGVEWESKASSLEPENKAYAEIVGLMKQSRPTYGANFEGIKHIDWNGYVFKKFVIVQTGDKKPLAGVSVLNKRTKETQTTAEKGYVGLDVMVGDVLVVSAPGNPTQELKVTKTPGNFELVLKPGS